MNAADIVGDELEVKRGRNIDQASDRDKDDDVGMTDAVVVDTAVGIEGQEVVGLPR